MDVRHLFARVCDGVRAGLRARLRAHSRVSLGERPGVAAPSALVPPVGAFGAGLVVAGGAMSRRRSSLATWMEDARRVRPRRAPAGRLRLGDQAGEPTGEPSPVAHPASRRPLSAIPAMPVNPAARLGVGGVHLPVSEAAPHALASAAPTPAATPGVAPGAAPGAIPLPPDILVDFTSELSAETLAVIEGMDTTQRRLIFLRYLVRQGVYNEGFRERVLPEQYWRSRGVESPPQ